MSMRDDAPPVVAAVAAGPGGALGAMLREWRALRGRSQLALSLDTDISQRHLSCIESGRSAPGRVTLLRIANALALPLRDRNALFLAAGFAPPHRDPGWNDGEMHGITASMERMLRQQEPYPALLMDRYWTVLSANRAAFDFFNLFVDMRARPAPRNMLHLLFDPAGLRPHVRNWSALATAMLGRLRREQPGGIVDAAAQALIDSLLRYPDVPAPVGSSGAGHERTLPMIPLVLDWNGVSVSYFSILCTVGTPVAIAAQELRLECLFPADAETERQHMVLMAAAAGGGAAVKPAAPPPARPAPARRRLAPARSGDAR